MDASAAPTPPDALPTAARRPWFERGPIDLGELAVETIAVVMGILLALAIDDWHGARQDAALVDSAMQAIRSETARNRDSAQSHRSHLEHMAATMLQANDPSASPRPCREWRGWAGVEPPMFLDTAYQVAIATQAVGKMTFAQASAVGEVYGAQRYMQAVYGQTRQLLLADRAEPLQVCTGILRELARGTARLATRYSTPL